MTFTPETRLPEIGDYGVTPGGGLAMAIVRWATKSDYGHACVLVDKQPDKGLYLIIEATPRGTIVRRKPRGVLKTVLTERQVLGNWAWSDRPLTSAQRAKAAELGMGMIGRRYDWWSIFLFVLRFWHMQVKGRSDDHPDRTVICSEAVAWIYREIGDDMFPGVAPGDVSPGMLGETRHGGIWVDGEVQQEAEAA